MSNASNVTYSLSPLQLSAIGSGIRSIFSKELETEADAPPAGWFWFDDIEQVWRSGYAEETVEFNRLIAKAQALGLVEVQLQPVEPEVILATRAYRDALSSITVQNYGTIKSLGNSASDRVIQTINSGIRSGKPRNEIINDISESMDISKSSAKRIADTEINRAYNDARLDAAKQIGRRSGLTPAVKHISALLQTTRETHADRHGNIYTPEEQAQWWDTGSNRINCHCSTRTVLIGEDGAIVEQEAR
jgi:SPP1 gp7 family putative phage head morphogenesis protein